jgi:uncharacterized protein (TIGR03118 family)
MRAISYIVAIVAVGSVACGTEDDGGSNVQAARSARTVTRTDIVSDERGATTRDTTLVNAWGLAFNPLGAAWVSSTEEGVSEVYNADGEALISAVTIPGPDGDAGSPTGQVYNGDEEEFEGDSFIFVTEEGTIAGWSASDGDEAKVRVDNSGDDAVYKGVTIATPENETPLLFAADFRNAKIDVFDATYEPVTGSDFSDSDIPDGYAPFNVKAIEDSLIVTYAQQDEEKEDDVKGPGKGYVNLFDLEGNLQKRLISKGELDAPWGIALAPTSFTAAPGRLLIGNFGDGLIHVYDVDLSPADEASADLEGTLRDSSGDDIAIDGLWALEFGVAAGGFAVNTLYFTAGPDDEEHGLFGSLESASSGGGGSTGTTGGYTTGGY